MRSDGKNLSLTFSAEPDLVPTTRRALTEFAEAAGADRETVDAVRLASSEALTNAVIHAYPDEPGQVYVTAAVASTELWILIADDGPGMEPRTNRPGLGLGLGLISQVTDEMAIVSRSGGGTEVRMRFDLIAAKSARRGQGSATENSRTSEGRGGGSPVRQLHIGRLRAHSQSA
jgi:anti-sigma regulatory factor (Ser/Thr protein kinase)